MNSWARRETQGASIIGTASRAGLAQRGFSLAELLVAMAVVGLLLTGLVTLQMTGTQAYVTGTNQIEAQQAVRVALERMGNETRQAGYSPTGLPDCSQPPPCFNRIVGVPPSFQSPTTSTGFSIQNDNNGDGVISPTERIAYTLQGTDLQRQDFSVDVEPQTIIGGVLQLQIRYFDVNGTSLAMPTGIVPPASIPLIRSLEVAITTQPDLVAQPGSWSTGKVQVSMVHHVRIRNR